MANYAATRAKHATLTASAVDTVTLGADYDRVEVLNRGTVVLYFTADGTIPTAGGDNCDVVLGGGALQVDVPSSGQTVVKVISTAATPYSVRGL